MESLLAPGPAIDVALLDTVVAHAYDGSSPSRADADRVLTELKQRPDAWTKVDKILETASNPNSKFFALSVLEETIQFRWKALPKDQTVAIRGYIVQKIVKLASDEAVMAREAVLIRKLNLILVQVVKHEWPANWPSFIPDLVGSSKSSEVLCENNMNILKLLSEEIFDFSKDQMTTAKIKHMKESLNKEFHQIFQLCEFVLSNARRPSLLSVTLATLHRFLTWIPVGYIFETKLLETLCLKFLPVAMFRVGAVDCLAEIAALVDPKYDAVFTQMYLGVMTALATALPPTTDIAATFEAGDEDYRDFIQRLSLFFSAYFRAHLPVLEAAMFKGALPREAILRGMEYLVKITDNDEVEVFKICLEYWLHFSHELYVSDRAYVSSQPSLLLALSGPTGGTARPRPASPRKELYAGVLSVLRGVLIRHMPKPEEVLIEEDDMGEIVRITTKDTSAIALYKTMRDTLVFLTHLDFADMERIMQSRLARQVDGSEWGWDALNTLCWAIGAISGTMVEEDEKRFLVTVIKDLLGLCEAKKGKNNKAVIASNIMYVVGQYPRFLKAHWKFLKTVVNKLFEFMHELHPGVQDMACDTFLKIAQRCRSKFVVVQPTEHRSFVEELCKNIGSVIADLQSHQVHTFYEAVGSMIAAHSNPKHRELLVDMLMELPNSLWRTIMSSASANMDVLKESAAITELIRILRTNERVCKTTGPQFGPQMGRMYLDMLNVYKAFSGFISASIAAGGEAATRTTTVKQMRRCKKEVLCLIQTFVKKSNNPKFIAEKFIPPLLEPILDDYTRNIPAARNTEVLALMTDIVSKLRAEAAPHVARIMGAVFQCTLEMITKNFLDYPEHRDNFYRLLKELLTHCFPAVFSLDAATQKLVIDSLIWAFKHPQREIADTGLQSLQFVLEQMAGAAATPAAQGFFKAYLLPLLQDLLYVLTDRLHKSAFKMHATLLQHISSLVERGVVTEPLFDPATAAPGMSNQRHVREVVGNLIIKAFGHVSQPQVMAFVVGMFDMAKDPDAYKTHLRDFLVELKEFSAEDNADLFADEAAAAKAAAAAAELAARQAVPGLIKPADVTDDDDL